jgi:Bacterial alpha-L-rhamnosidase 6 hairpin glycosidase domain/Bacterial alpha-L-rhamnosidase C-terminal domain
LIETFHHARKAAGTGMDSTKPKRPGRYRGAAACAVAAAGIGVAVLVPPSAQAAGPGGAATLSATPVAARSDWASYVEAPSSRDVRPVRVVRVTGQVDNPSGLVQGGSGTTTLTYPVGGTAPVLVLDYGREVGGYADFSVTSAPAPTVLQSAYSEVLANLTATGDGGAPSGLNNSGSPARSDRFPVSGPATVTSPGIQGGERYELVTLALPGQVTLSSAGIQFTPYLGTPGTYAGWFESSSDLLNRIWYAGAYTANLTQVIPGTPGTVRYDLPVVLDGAKRDRAVWAGDLNVADRTLWDVLGPPGGEYARGSLTVVGDHPATGAVLGTPAVGAANLPGPMPGVCQGPSSASCDVYSATYSMDFVLNVYDYYLYSGDQAFVQQEWPLVQRELAWEQQQVDSSGLFSINVADGADWNVNIHSGDYTAPSVLHYQSLLDGAALAGALGDTVSATSYRAQAAAVKSAVSRSLWDAALGAYDASTTERGFLVQDANVWAVLAGLTTPAQSGPILAHLAQGLSSQYGMLNVASGAPPDYGQIVSPYIGSYTLWADYQAGRPDLALSLLNTEWGWMVSHDPGGTTWEKIESGGGLSGFDSAAHAWGTGATSALSQYVLGAQPVTPGFRTWLVQPQPSGLAWAQGQVPTASGALASRWEVGAGNSSLRLTVAAPGGTSGTVAVPLLGSSRPIAEDGRVVWDGSGPVGGIQAYSDGSYVYFTGITGTHTWAWEG